MSPSEAFMTHCFDMDLYMNLNFSKQDTFLKCVAECYEEWKCLLLIMADLSDDMHWRFLKDMFTQSTDSKPAHWVEDGRITNGDLLREHFKIYGLEPGSREAFKLTEEFSIKDIPFLCSILPQDDYRYTVIECYQ